VRVMTRTKTAIAADMEATERRIDKLREQLGELQLHRAKLNRELRDAVALRPGHSASAVREWLMGIPVGAQVSFAQARLVFREYADTAVHQAIVRECERGNLRRVRRGVYMRVEKECGE